LRLLLRKKGQGPRSDRNPSPGQEGRQARHGRLWLFGSGRRLAPIRTTASQSTAPEDQRLAPYAKTSTLPAEGGAREVEVFDRVVRAGDGIHHVKVLAHEPERQRGSRTSKYIREVRMLPSRHRSYLRLADPQRVTRCVTAPSRAAPLPSSKGGRNVRLGRLPSRKPSHRWVDRYFRLKRQRQRHSPAAPVAIRSPFLPHQQSDCACVAPWWRPLNHKPCQLGLSPTAAPDVMGASHPKLHLGPLFVPLATLESGFVHDRVAGSGLDAQSKAACLRMQGAAHHARYLCRHRVQKRGRLVSFGPVNEGGAPASRGGQQESSHRVPRLPHSFGTASSMYVPAVSCVCADRMPVGCSPVEPHAGMESTRPPRGLHCRVGGRPI
jgi:hypothetical protein